jgi:hypothetical protein
MVMAYVESQDQQLYSIGKGHLIPNRPGHLRDFTADDYFENHKNAPETEDPIVDFLEPLEALDAVTMG